MDKVELRYDFAARRQDKWVRNALMDLLHAVQEQGSISGAARQLELSYRHVWGELRRWEAQLAHPLILWEKGQRARLAPFGEKLLWAERQAQARLAPQIEALHAELERAFAVAFDDTAQVLTLFASHDDGLSLLRGVAVQQARLHLDVRFCGSVDAISALNAGRCTLAGFHSSQQPGLGTLTQRTYQPLLQERYYLVCLKEALEQPALVALRRVLETEQWQQALSALPGYAPWKSGEVLSLKEQLPWWNLPPKKRAKG